MTQGDMLDFVRGGLNNQKTLEGFDVKKKQEGLFGKFLVPPFSILDTRQGYWQDRKRAWLSLGIKSELGRNGDIVPNGTSLDSSQDGVYMRKTNTPGSSNDYREGRDYGDYEGGHAWLSNGKGRSRSFAQDLMKQEHVVGEPVTEDVEISGAGISIFDPVLCELAYRWFSPINGIIIDPFAGGSVRGIVASVVGRQYLGVDLSKEQVGANKAQLGIATGPIPQWNVGDSTQIGTLLSGVQADLLFTCPPYYNLEQYGDDPNDLSNAPTYEEFLVSYRKVINGACGLLKNNTFAVIVVGDVRDKRGLYYNFPGDTIQAFQDAGLKLYNEAILTTAVGSLMLRVGNQFNASRKMGKSHQNVYVFVKGDPKAATKACGTVDFGFSTR